MNRLRSWNGTLGIALGLALVAVALLWAGDTRAEPYFTVREGYKCSKCHVNMTGGSTRTDYAKVYMETRMAASEAVPQKEDGSLSGDFGHGRLSRYFAFGADLRQQVEYRHFSDAGNTWQFGRRSSCESCHAATDGGGKRAEFYAQLDPMPGKASIVIAQNLLPQPTTREAYGIVQIDWLNSYVKAGVFRMPTGFRNTFDDPFVHGSIDAGNDDLVGLVAVRGDGVEFGMEPGNFAFSVSLTNTTDPTDKRLHLNGYWVSNLMTLGATYYTDPVSATQERSYLGLYGGFTLGRITALGEMDTITESDPSAGTETKMSSVLGEIDYLISRGHNLKWQYEAFDPDTGTDGDIPDRSSIVYEPFYTPYLQVRTGLRRWMGPRGTAGNNGTTVFAELHLMY
jgi:hypothetical protein